MYLSSKLRGARMDSTRLPHSKRAGIILGLGRLRLDEYVIPVRSVLMDVQLRSRRARSRSDAILTCQPL